MGEVSYEPDRMMGSLNVGPRVMVSREGLDRSGLILPGSRAAERFLFRLSPQSPGIERTRAALKAAFPDALIADFRESHPIVTQGLNRATTFLSLVSLITLIIGAIGVGTAMRGPYPTAHGLHRHHEMHRRAIQSRDADLFIADRRARAGGRFARCRLRFGCPARLPCIPGALF